jgi:hypothetical protein
MAKPDVALEPFRRSLVAVALLALSPCASAASVRAVDVAAVADAQGARVALERFFECRISGEEAYAKVASGSEEWLRLAVRLLKDSDACFTESLQDAIARALIPAPTRVLAVVDSSELLRAERICVPFLSAEEEPKKHLAYLRRAQAALAVVATPRLQMAKRACLREMRKMRRSLTVTVSGHSIQR